MLFKIQGTGCNNINFTFISSQKDALLKFLKSEFRRATSFSCISKKKAIVFDKITVMFRHNIVYRATAFAFHDI